MIAHAVLLLAVVCAAPVAGDDVTAMVAAEGAFVSLEVAQTPQGSLPLPQPTEPQPVGAIRWPHDAVKEALDKAKTAFAEDVKRIAESAQVQASVRVTFPEAPKMYADPPDCSGGSCCVPPVAAAVDSPPPTEYGAALAEHGRTGEPLAVLVGMPGCPACEQASSALAKVSIPRVYLDVTTHRDLVRQNLNEIPARVPVLIVFRSDGPTERIEWPQLLTWLKGHTQ